MNNVVPFKTKGEHKEPHPADDLSFMRRRKPKGTGIDYWVVESTGSYETDCKKGRRLGVEFLSYVAENNTYGNTTLLTQIVSDIVDHAAQQSEVKAGERRLSGIEIGFLNVVGRCASAAAGVIQLSRLAES
jgi:hypothetical protein